MDYDKHSFTEEEQNKIRQEFEIVSHKYPDRVPIIVKCKSKSLKLTKKKFLMMQETSLGELLYIIRRRLDKALHPSVGLYIIINNKLLPPTQTLIEVYNSNKDEATGMLFVTLCQESTFGYCI